MPLDDFQGNPSPYFTAAKLGLKAFGIDVPGIGDIPGVGKVLGKVGGAFGGRGSATVSHPGISFGQTTNPVIQSYFLDIPTEKVQGRRRGSDVFKRRQKPIGFAVDETKRRLRSLGMTSEADEFEGLISKLTAHRSNEGIPLQQTQLNAIKAAEDLISRRFDQYIGSVRASGGDLSSAEKIRQEFNRQSQERAFNFNKSDFIANLKKASSNAERISGSGDEPYLPLDSFINPGRTDARLLRFQEKYFPSSHGGKLTQTDAYNIINSAFKANEGELIKRFDNIRNAKQAFYRGHDIAGRTADFGSLFFPDSPDVSSSLRTPVTDITSFLSSFNPNAPGQGQKQPPKRERSGISRNDVLGLASKFIPRFLPQNFKEFTPRTRQRSGFSSFPSKSDFFDLEQAEDRIIPSGFISKQPTTENRAIDPSRLEEII